MQNIKIRTHANWSRKRSYRDMFCVPEYNSSRNFTYLDVN